MSDANVQVVQKIYERFGDGDIPGVINLLSKTSSGTMVVTK